MPKKQIGVSFEPETVDALDALAAREDTTRQALIDRGVALALAGAGREQTPVLTLSTSQIECLDELAERTGVPRVDLMRRWLTERLNREFVNDRNRKLQDVGRA
jgi:predicted transcriptional regulator